MEKIKAQRTKVDQEYRHFQAQYRSPHKVVDDLVKEVNIKYTNEINKTENILHLQETVAKQVV